MCMFDYKWSLSENNSLFYRSSQQHFRLRCATFLLLLNLLKHAFYCMTSKVSPFLDVHVVMFNSLPQNPFHRRLLLSLCE